MFAIGFVQFQPCAILNLMKDYSERPAWAQSIHAHGLDGALHVVLDVLEPLGPLGAQLVWITQPALAMWFPRETLQKLAETLEMPGGFEQIRQQLDERHRG